MKYIHGKENSLVLSLLVLLLLFLPSVSATDGVIELYDPFKDVGTLQYNENLVFSSCPPGDHIKTQMTCGGKTTQIEMVPWEGCVLGSHDLRKAECNEITIETFYRSGGKDISSSLKLPIINKISIVEDLLLKQGVDGGFGTALETAQVVHSLSFFEDKYKKEMNEALGWLKQNRNNDKKCWPATNCSLTTTARIFSLLSLAEVDTTFRVLRDSKTYIEDVGNYIYGEQWKATITSFNSTTCTFTQTKSSGSTGLSQTFTVTENDTAVYDLTASYSDKLVLDCIGEKTFLIVENSLKDEVFRSPVSNDYHSYTVEGPCWSDDGRWNSCDTTITLYAAIGSINATTKDGTKSWLDRKLKNDGTSKQFFDVTNMTYHSALYVNHLVQDQHVIDWLVYHQNNDGSWNDTNTTEKIIPTAQSFLALSEEYNYTMEFMKDAKQWILEHYPEGGFDSIEENTAVLPIIYNDLRPILRSDPPIIQAKDGPLELHLHNPTEFNLKGIRFTFSKDLQKFFDYDNTTILNISSNKSLRFSIPRTQIPDGVYLGHMHFFKDNYTYITIPVRLTQEPEIHLSYPSSWEVLGDSTKLPLTVKKSDSSFACEMTLDNEENSGKKFVIRDEGLREIPLRLTSGEKNKFNFSGEIVCEASGNVFTFPLAFEVKKYPDTPFKVPAKKIRITRVGDAPTITVQNLIQEEIDVRVAYTGADASLWEAYLPLEADTLTLKSKKKGKIRFLNQIPPDKNTTMNMTVRVSFLDYEKDVHINVQVFPKPEGSIASLLMWVALALLLGLVVVGVLKRDLLKQAIKQRSLKVLFKKKGKEEEEEVIGDDMIALAGKKRLTKEEAKLVKASSKMLSDIDAQMFSILQALGESTGKDKKQLAKILKEKGFTDNDIERHLGVKIAKKEEKKPEEKK